MLSARVVFFDLGGTLFLEDAEAWPTIYDRAEQALWVALRGQGIRITAREVYAGCSTLLDCYYQRRGTGLDEPGTQAFLTEMLETRGVHPPDGAVAAALRAMYAVTQTNWRLDSDAVPTLELLKARGLRTGVISNGADEANAVELLVRDGVDRYFDCVLTSAAFGRRKPDPRLFRAALEHFHAAPEQAVMVGDDLAADVGGSHAVGMAAIWIRRGQPALPAAASLQPEAVVESLKSVPSLLR